MKEDNKEETKNNKAKAKPQRTESAPTKKTKKAFMYLGPNLPNGQLFNGACYTDEVPEYVQEIYKNIPELKKLFVPIDKDFPKAKSKVEQEGTELNRLYNVVKEKQGSAFDTLNKKGVDVNGL